MARVRDHREAQHLACRDPAHDPSPESGEQPFACGAFFAGGHRRENEHLVAPHDRRRRSLAGNLDLPPDVLRLAPAHRWVPIGVSPRWPAARATAASRFPVRLPGHESRTRPPSSPQQSSSPRAPTPSCCSSARRPQCPAWIVTHAAPGKKGTTSCLDPSVIPYRPMKLWTPHLGLDPPRRQQLTRI